MTPAAGTAPFAWAEDGTLDTRRVTQCALSRICGVCGAGLGRPIAFLGTQEEVDRNAFHAPPLHLACGERLLATGGADGAAGSVLVTTAGFEYVRAAKEDADRRATFRPNSLLRSR
ncbi:hypothetical protein [Nocardioides donggukensis]|uniref:Uncharacterized protein n=1 Tax=Nocardioides donggukensis TaxID=2774019 RepID=A0A927K4T5_9ACTN|nr:hypothetical protein [Nocardioides donggukensis]MBD8870519.1 hypothetical protein [Nocardioides donggukensis]